MGANANIYGDLEDWTDPQRLIIDRQLDRIYDDFLERVADSRGITTEEVHAMAEGRVFTGVQALEKGLVDELGGFDTALAAAKKLAGIDADIDVALLDYPKIVPWWQQMIEKKKGEEAAVAELTATLQRWVNTGEVETPGVVWMPPITIE
ncbi:MAG: S49 family peptidase [Thermoanaerobaculales bacterium]|nr:S49 family peptidase [Thermoanaerobaculales bacterium]